MLKKVGAVLFVVAFSLSVSMIGFAQKAEKQKAEKQARVEGQVVRSNPDKMTLTVRVRSTDSEKTVNYDASTKWTSQFHGAKKANVIEVGDVKDGDQVICVGSYDDKQEFHASMCSKRLSHSP